MQQRGMLIAVRLTDFFSLTEVWWKSGAGVQVHLFLLFLFSLVCACGV
jgi:hypothetical protein